MTRKTTIQDELLTQRETLEFLRISRTTLWRILREHRIKRMRVGRRLVFYKRDLKRFLERSRQ